MPLRFFGPLLLACLTSLSALAQGYQTSFSEVKFDRAKGPATFNAGVEVDAASGAASMNIPFGPGIGERGLKFRPVLSMRLAPQFGISSADENYVLYTSSAGIQTWGAQTIDTLYQRGYGSASFSPGSLDLGTMVSTIDARRTSYNLPGGSGGQVSGQVPTALTQSVVQTLLGKYGFSAADTVVGFLPGQTTASRALGIEMGSTGHLVVALRSPGPVDPVTGCSDEVQDDIQGTPATSYRWHFPRRIAVIQEEAAYEFHYVEHNYMTRVIPYLANSQKNQLYSGHYLLTKIRNRFGESIDFVYDADGIGYTATWSTNPAVRICVAVVGTFPAPSGQPCLMDSRFNLTNVTRIQVTYQGVSQPVSSYLLEVSNPRIGSALGLRSGGGPDSATALGANGRRATAGSPSFDAEIRSVQPVRVVQEGSNEEISLHYGLGPVVSWSTITLTPTVLTGVSFPTRFVDLRWQSFRFRMNYNVESWGGTTSGTQPGRPAFTCGVVSSSDGRGYTHTRVTPVSNWITDIPLPGTAPTDQWVDTTFYDAITHPDGTISVHRFVEPPMTPGGMQDLAFLKTLEREIRYYAPGANWQADLAVTAPSASSAYKWVVKDRYDVRSVSAPTGNPSDQSVPYPTRVRSWDKESQVLNVEETTDWDAVACGWKTVHRTTAITAVPSLTLDLLSLPQQGLSYTPYAATQGVYRRVDRTFDPKPEELIFARVKTEQTTTVNDNTGFLAAGVTLPDAQPLVTKAFNTAINRVDSMTVSNSGAPTVTTSFSFQGTSGLSGIQLLNAYLSAPGLALSGQLGVSAYGYDANGYMNTISQKPNAGTMLTVNQTSDELGRPMTQTDLNGTIKTFTYDLAGRLSSISYSDLDEATSIVYHPDHLGATVTHGLQVSEYRYNGFGELVLERRTAPDGTKSHRIYGYDAAGRRTGETVWQPGDGLAHEGDWLKSNLTRSVTTTVTIPTTRICKKWGFDADGNAVCITWQTIPGSTTTTTSNALYVGASSVYDSRGRVILTQDANNTQTTTDYSGPGFIRKITVGSAQVKWFESDAMGRLVRVTTPVTRYADPLKSNATTIQNLTTEYCFDGGDRIKTVKQFDEVGRVQTRTWGYNRLGWLETLGQPESGITAYSGFTVAGKPTVTNYNGRVVQITLDWMGRPLNITSTDGTVSQSFIYDTALNGKGRLAISTDGSVSNGYSYGGQGKRLDSLVTTVPVQGTAQSFTQTFTYDTYGNRVSGNTSHNTWTQTYHAAAGLPNVLSYGAATVADTRWSYYDANGWMLKQVGYGNGTKSLFEYCADQARLAQVTHSPTSGGPFAQWAYTYDGVGNLIRENDLLTGAFDQYTFDELNRLIAAVVQSPTYGEQLQQFDYDAFGNRTSSNLMRVTSWSGAKGASTAYTTISGLMNNPSSQVVNASFTQGTAELLQNRLPSFTSAGVPTGALYDSQGNLTQVYERPTSISPAVISMTYDALGRVTSASNSRTGLTETYQYTTEGLRTVIQEYNSGAFQKTRINLYNDGRQLVSQYEKATAGTLTWKRDIVYLGTREAAEIDAVGMHITMVDHLGSPRIVTGPGGAKEAIQKYLPFGELLEQTPGTFKTAKGYTNHEQTDSSGLIYMQARFYVPWFGRFASPDPARDQHFEETQSWNIYSYVRNNPVMSTDPTGMIGEGNAVTRSMSASADHSWQMQNEEEKKKAERKSTNDGAPKPAPGVIPAGGTAPSVTPGTPAADKPATKPAKPNAPRTSPEKSVLDRFLDGYEHAGDNSVAKKAIALGSTIEGTKTILEAPRNLTLLSENAVGAAQAYGAGWAQGGNILARGAAVGAFTAFVLDGLALEGGVQIGKITAGVGNIFNDAY